ncbi:uncharacterized protein BO66DRAFT_323899 [Aspergillus aculeatinus CBS 121060]|uniref:Uncharacterized protein n=1 Tax=Aspergillus aculeatinus CBS 121060 TaxID=1448322 RepID=A0ACD1H8W2_9EURO|nr:hypothetical protein BO66DRAFT_323899 [Aspergillus aculeatinus CBS 121060]RAH69867.1 hypothetical protein BO66DRAFT_323899 [Aspergillus aculeatinus CBS 121060]
MDLPQISGHLSPTPHAYPTCCLALSSTLVTYLGTILPAHPGFTLSIGSGSGLLEALITLRHATVTVEGVEVSAAVNRYIDELDMNVVQGTWDLLPRAARAAAWMFVYPREPALVRRYLDGVEGCGGGGGGAVRMVVWLGPRADWGDYVGCFDEGVWVGEELGEEVGVTGYEVLVVLRKREKGEGE